jgi:hypothetical protein
MSLPARLKKLEAARGERERRLLAGWSAAELARFVRRAAPAALGLTAEQVAGLSDEDLARLTADALDKSIREELGLPREREGR